MAVLRSGQIAAGPEVARLERRLGDVVGMPHVLATSSGTAALHLALLSLGVRPGQPVLIPCYACSSLLHAVNYVGAVPVLIDCEPGGFNMDVASASSRAGTAVIAAHLFGVPMDVEPLCGRPLVEDCAQALGARLRGRPVGSFGDVSVFSFYATKMLAAGEGGALACRSARVHATAADLGSYDERPHYRVRYNYRMTDVEAALARVQLERLEEFISRRAAVAQMYRVALADLDVLPLVEGAVDYRFIVRIRGRRLAAVMRRMQADGVYARRPVYRPLSRDLGLPLRDFPNAERAHAEILSLPLYPSLSDADVERVVGALRRALT